MIEPTAAVGLWFRADEASSHLAETFSLCRTYAKAKGFPTMEHRRFIIVLNDGSTYSDIEGCRIVNVGDLPEDSIEEFLKANPEFGRPLKAVPNTTGVENIEGNILVPRGA